MNWKRILKLVFSLDEFVIPSIIRLIYILSFIATVVYYLHNALSILRYSFQSFLVEIVFMLLSLLALRMATEILYLWFAIYDALRELRDNCRAGGKPERNLEVS